MKQTLAVLTRIVIPGLQKSAPFAALLFLLLLIGLVIYLQVYGNPFNTDTIDQLVPENTPQNVEYTEPKSLIEKLANGTWERYEDGITYGIYLDLEGSGAVYTIDAGNESSSESGIWVITEENKNTLLLEWAFTVRMTAQGQTEVFIVETWAVVQDPRSENVIMVQKGEEGRPYRYINIPPQNEE